MLNPYILQSEALARRINNMYIAMVRKTPRLFGAVYTAGLSSTEAAVCGVPILHTAAIPCCERYNAAYFSAHGMSSLCRVPSEIVACAMAILSNPEKCVAMVERQYAMLDGAAAARICRFAETMTLK